MTWASPHLLSLLLLVPVVLAVVVLAVARRRRAMADIASVEALARLVPAGAGRARAWQAALAVLAVSGLVLAAAGPRLGFDWQLRKVEGVSIVVVLDVSRSMDAQDLKPSRMVVARRKVADFTAELRGDAVGLVLFAAGAFARIPLTVDYDTFRWAVDDSTSDTIRAQGTSLAGAIDVSTQMLSRAKGSGKAILLVGDGEGHDDAAELDAAVARAKEAGVRIYALGIGEPAGAPIPVPEGGFHKDSAQNVVLSRLDEARFAALAEATGGAYVRAVASNDDVRALYQDEMRARLEASERGETREKIWRERFQWPLALGLLAMVLSAWLGIGRRAVVTAAMLLLAPRAWAGVADEGLSAWKAGEWARAAELLGQARVEAPEDVRIGHALAESLYRSGRYREAESVFESLAAVDESNRAEHLFNAGNSAYRGGRLEDAVKDFTAAAEARPDFAPAAKNGEAVKKEIALRLQEKPPEPPPQEGEGEQQEGEQADQPQGDQAQPQDEQPQPGEQQPGQPGEGEGTGQQPEMEVAEPAGEEQVAGEPSGEGMSKEEAARLVEGVEDGTPRVRVGGGATEKDW